MTTTTACTVHGPACERIHVGDAVKVVYGEGQVGFGSTGTVIATTQYGDYVVAFDTPVVYTANGDTSTYARLTYAEHELAKLAQADAEYVTGPAGSALRR